MALTTIRGAPRARFREAGGSSVLPVRTLAEHTTLRLGGPAGGWEDAEDESSLIEAAENEEGDLLLLGGGSNIVVADKGFEGTVVHVRTRGIERCRDDGERVELRVQAGEDWDELVALTVAEGLAGIECLSGIPGTVGATPIQNVGAYDQALEDTLTSVRAFDRKRGRVVNLNAKECRFAYRNSRFKREAGRFVILSVDLELKRQLHSLPLSHPEVTKLLGISAEDCAPLADVRAAVIDLRRAKGMVLDDEDPDTYSTGSFFTNPFLDQDAMTNLRRRLAERELDDEGTIDKWASNGGLTKVPAAWLIQQAGISKGEGNPNGVAISSKHTLALTNRGGGTTCELVAFAQWIARKVRKAWGVLLTPEPIFVGHNWIPATRDRPPQPSAKTLSTACDA